jgi:hypothetical protein
VQLGGGGHGVDQRPPGTFPSVVDGQRGPLLHRSSPRMARAREGGGMADGKAPSDPPAPPAPLVDGDSVASAAASSPH